MRHSIFGKGLKRIGLLIATVACLFCLLIGSTACVFRLRDYATYDFSVVSNNTEWGSVVCDVEEAKKDDELTMTATANYGYEFLGWFDGDVLLSKDLTYVYVMPAEDKTLEARFGARNFHLSVTSETQGFATIEADYPYLSEVSLSANVINGAEFIGWFEDGKLFSEEVSVSIVIEKDHSIVAEYFTLVPYRLISLPQVEESKPGEQLKDVVLTGGETTIPGYFYWVDDTEIVIADNEYMVEFVPIIRGYEPVKYMISVPISVEILSAPVVSLENGVLSWEAVTGASSYTVMVNEEEHDVALDTEYVLPTEIDEYYVSVRAEGDDNATFSSDYSGTMRYVPAKPSFNEIGFGSGSCVYEQGELTKYGGSFKIKDTQVYGSAGVEVTDEYVRFAVNVDVAQYIKAKTKREILRLNALSTINQNLSVMLNFEVKMYDLEFYAEADMDFPFTMEDLALGVSYKTMTTSLSEISINGEFVASENRRSTLHLLFFDLVGLEEPIYKWQELDIPIPGTSGLLNIELSVCFDALGAIASTLCIDTVENTDFNFGLQLIKDGVPLFLSYYERNLTAATYNLELMGELDVNLNFIRLSATLELATLDIARLNLDLLNLETDLSGEASLSLGVKENGEKDETASAGVDLSGAYRLYGQVTFEYYLEIRSRFSFLPLDEYRLKIMDGSLILAEWELAKGGLPKLSYKDEAASAVTPIYATDGNVEFFKNKVNALIQTETDFGNGKRAGFLDSEEIVDIDNNYVYVFSGGDLRRVGRYAGTERVVVSDISYVLGSDRNFIYYALKDTPHVINAYYRTDYESKEPVLTSLPKGWTAIRMRYDYTLDEYVIYAEKEGVEGYFTYDGYSVTAHGANEHKYWDKIEYESGVIAFFRMDKNRLIKECFIRYPNGGVVHEDEVLSVGISPLGIFIVKEKEGGILPYEMGLYKLEDGYSKYVELSEVADENTARRVSYYDGNAYYTDLGEGKIRIFKTDGETATLITTKQFNYISNQSEGIYAEMHGSWLFLYTYKPGSAKVIFTINVETLRYAPYIVDGVEQKYDRGEPYDVSFDIVGGDKVTGVFLSTMSEEQLAVISDGFETLQDYIDKESEILEAVEDYVGFTKEAMERVFGILQSSSSLFQYISAGIDVVQTTSEDGILTVTIPKDDLKDHEYGLYHGYIVTTNGVVAFYLKVTDSRLPYVVTTEDKFFDKADPKSVEFDVCVYDEKYTLKVPYGKYSIVKKSVDTITVTLYASYLAELPYGENAIEIALENEEILELPVYVTDTRSPSDTTYYKTFDKAYRKNVVFSFTMYDEKYITDVTGEDVPTLGAYSVNTKKGTLTFYYQYLKGLSVGEHNFEVHTAEKTFIVTVRVVKTMSPTLQSFQTIDLKNKAVVKLAFEKNDAYAFDLFIGGKALKAGVDYSYNEDANELLIFDEYLQNNVAYGTHTVTLKALVQSGDEIRSVDLFSSLTIMDSRAPVMTTTTKNYSITKNANALSLRVETYNNNVARVIADKGTANEKTLSFRFRAINAYGDKDYRGGYIEIPASSIADVLSEGTHKLTIAVGNKNLTSTVTIVDDRMPEAIETVYWYDVVNPTAPTFAVRFYGEQFNALSSENYPITTDDYKVTEIAGYPAHTVRISAEYMKTLPLVAGNIYKFVVTTSVNHFELKVRCYDSTPSANPEKPPQNNVETPNGGIYYPITSFSTPVVTPESQSLDKANPVDLSYEVNYGDNNSFGSITKNGFVLIKGVHYLLTETGITLRSNYLTTLGYGTHTFTLWGAKGYYRTDSFYVNVYDTRTPELLSETSHTFDRFDGENLALNAKLYDSVVASLTIDGTVISDGAYNRGDYVIINKSAMKALSLGDHTLEIRFNDCDTIFTVTLTVNDSGLYFDSVVYADKFAYLNADGTLNDKTFFVPWTIYEGEVTKVENAPFTLVGYTNEGITFSGIGGAEYKDYVYYVTANGHEFKLIVNVYDSRKPYMETTTHVFDKGAYEYTLDPITAASYDLHVWVELYDEAIDGVDALTNQTLVGGNIDYSGYKRINNEYWLSYLYLYRLREGTYSYYIKTTDGNVNFTVQITDSRAPELVDADPVIYDYATGEDQTVTMILHGEVVSSVSYVNDATGSKLALTPAQYAFEKNEEGQDVLVIRRNLLEGFFMSTNYEFEVSTTTERTLTFNLKLVNGPRRPYNVVFYSVPWDRGEPSVNIDNQIVYEGDYIVKPEDPTHEHFNFLGWYTERTGGAKFDFSKPVKSDCDIFLHWQPKKYQIYMINEGEIFKTVEVAYLSDIPNLTKPTREGYTFVKWTTDEAHKVRFTQEGETMPAKSFPVYAEWKINYYTVKFVNVNGVVISEQVIRAKDDAFPPSSEDMYVEGYVFKGWNDSYTNILYDRTLQAVYTPVPSAITYELNGGTNSKNNPATYTIADYVEFADPTRTGYTFVGWYDNEDLIGEQVYAIPFGTQGDVTVYAKWEAVEYVVLYNPNRPAETTNIVEGFMGQTYHVYDEPDFLPESEYTLDGYHFVGWSLSPNGNVVYGNAMEAQNIISTPTAVTLYAKWMPIIENPDNGHYYYAFNLGMTWKQAKEYCELMGGYLVTITTAKELSFVWNDVMLAYGHTQASIGYTDEGHEGIWEWVTGEVSYYQNWDGGEPNNTSGGEHHAVFNGGANGVWNDLLNPNHRFVCEWGDYDRPEDGLTYGVNVGTKYAVVLGLGECEDENLVIPAYCNDIPVTRIYANAFKDCTNLVSVIVPETVTTIDSTAFAGCSEDLIVAIPQETVPSAWATALAKVNVRVKGEWEYPENAQGEVIFYGDWEVYTAPTCITEGEERRYALNKEGIYQSNILPAYGETDEFYGHDWDDDFVCTVCGTALGEMDGVVEFNGHYYTLIIGKAGLRYVADSVAYAEAIGGYLATLTTEEENLFVYDFMVSQGYTNLFFGLTDYGHEGVWTWYTGEVSSYTNWDPRMPDNGSGIEHFGHYYPNATWNDHRDDAGLPGFIMEWGAYTVEDPKDYKFGIRANGEGVIYAYNPKVVENETTEGEAETVEKIGLVLPTSYNGVEITMLYENAFKNATNLSYIVIPETVKYIYASTFSGCTKDLTVYIPYATIPSDWASGLKNVTVVTNDKWEYDYQTGTLYLFEKGWELNYDPTCVNEGEEIRYCTNAKGFDQTRPIPALNETSDLYGHSWNASFNCIHCGAHLTEKVPGAQEFNGHYYYVFDHSYGKTWDAVNEFCEMLGGYLATITTEEENSGVYNILMNSGYGTKTGSHFGLFDYGHEGYYTWVTGEVSSYTAWGVGQPDNAGNTEHFIHYWTSEYDNYYWNDSHYEEFSTAFICEWGSYYVDQTSELAYGIDKYGTLTVYGIGNFEGTELEIPAFYNGLPVRAIAANAFKNCTQLTKITIGANVLTIGNNAFDGCVNVKEIVYLAEQANDLAGSNYVFSRVGRNTDGTLLTIGANVQYIPAFMFCPHEEAYKYSTRITRLVFEEGSVCTEIRTDAFDDAHLLNEVILPDGLTTIAAEAFDDCGQLTRLVLPASLVSIGNSAFDTRHNDPKGYTDQLGCAELSYVFYKGTEEQWKSVSIGTGNVFSNAVICYYSETRPQGEDGVYGNYWHYVDGKETFWSTVAFEYINDKHKLITDEGYWGLAQNNAETLDMRKLAKYLTSEYKLIFEVMVNMSEVNTGWQDIYLYSRLKSPTISDSYSNAVSYGLVDWSQFFYCGRDIGDISANQYAVWAVDGSSCKEVMYIRYDAGDDGKDPTDSGNDDWNRNSISVKVTILKK